MCMIGQPTDRSLEIDLEALAYTVYPDQLPIWTLLS